MSVPGKGDDGFILLDVLMAIFLIMIGFGAIFSSLKTAIVSVGKNEMRLEENLSLRNENSRKFEILKTYE